MTSSNARAIAVAAVVCIAAAAFAPDLALAQEPSASDLETARDLNKQGKELRAQGRLQEALEKFRAAHDLGRTPVTGIELARTQVLLNQLVEAREVCLGIARMPVASDETERSASARIEAAKLADDLRPRIPSITLHVTGVPAGKTAVVAIDGRALPAAAIGQPHKLNPGAHVVVARVENGPESRATVDVKEGETRDVSLAVELPKAPLVVTPKPAPAPPQRNKVAIVGFTIAGTGVAIGTMTGLLASSKKSNLDTLCSADKKCGPNAYDDLDSARTWGTVSTFAFVIGGIGLAIGVYGLIEKEEKKDERQPAARVTPFIGPGSVGIHGAF
jgi:hypothetical protein